MRLSRGCTKQERADAHKIKMLAKKKAREYWYRIHMPPYISANLSRNHPDYGMSMKEHLVAKAERAEKSS